jgi:hypothetical protein
LCWEVWRRYWRLRKVNLVGMMSNSISQSIHFVRHFLLQSGGQKLNQNNQKAAKSQRCSELLPCDSVLRWWPPLIFQIPNFRTDGYGFIARSIKAFRFTRNFQSLLLYINMAIFDFKAHPKANQNVQPKMVPWVEK